MREILLRELFKKLGKSRKNRQLRLFLEITKPKYYPCVSFIIEGEEFKLLELDKVRNIISKIR